MNYVKAETFEEAFKKINHGVLLAGDGVPSRTGDTREIQGLLVEVTNPELAVFSDKRINRIGYDYAEKFWEFMIQGGTDAQEAFKEYPGVAKFIAKPVSKELPENFNTFYGPRIKAQLPVVLDELKRNPFTRRAVIHILVPDDQVLLDKDETLEYPCTNSITFSIRNGKLNMHVHMRSENTAVVMQLDFYLMSRLMNYVANELGIPVGTYTSSIVSAHIYTRDIDYLKSFVYD